MKQKQLTFADVEELADWLEEVASKEEETKEEPKQPTMSPIERMITNFVNKCADEGCIPTKDQAEAIYLLDMTQAKYNGR